MLLIVVSSCSMFKPTLPQPEREFRGFWVATVVNIDWPKSGTDSIAKQKADFLKILDFYKDLNFNAAIVQVRTAGDAFYSSDYAPWSKYLTGKEGRAPQTEENILEWMIYETHKRGMEFHAWLNPYRATFDLNTTTLSENHDYYRHPDWMVEYGEKYYYNPGIPQIREHLVAILSEIVAQYDIDAIHFDDYFYPYQIKDEVFNDATAYKQYSSANQSLDDWRRSNVAALIQEAHQAIKKEKPWVQFGVSPFGVWKNKSTDPKGSDTSAGQTTYDDLYADPLLWMEQGWIDYIIPQAYWSMDLPAASHKKIVEWWAENSVHTNLYMGNGPYKIRNNADKAWDKKKELPNQIGLARATAAVKGNSFFSAKSLMENNEDVVKYLKRTYYKQLALPPIAPLLNVPFTKTPVLISKTTNDTSLQLHFDTLEQFRYVLVFTTKKKQPLELPFDDLLLKKMIENPSAISLLKKQIKYPKEIALIFIDKFGRETAPIFINLSTTNQE